MKKVYYVSKDNVELAIERLMTKYKYDDEIQKYKNFKLFENEEKTRILVNELIGGWLNGINKDEIEYFIFETDDRFYEDDFENNNCTDLPKLQKYKSHREVGIHCLDCYRHSHSWEEKEGEFMHCFRTASNCKRCVSCNSLNVDIFITGTFDTKQVVKNGKII